MKISSQDITREVARLFIEANYHIPEEIWDAWRKVLKEEKESSQAKEVIHVMIKNAWIAWNEGLPICQDTGQAVVVVEQGDAVSITGKPLIEAINEGIERGGKEGYLRKSVILDPLKRDNEGSYGPAVIHHRIVPGETFRLTVYPAGCGCEQMNCAAMFPPCNEEETIKAFVIQKVKDAGSRPCPPNIIGLGIGGDLEQSAYMARMALLRPIHIRSEKYEYLERSLAQAINRLNIGPQGLGGKTSVLAVNIEASSCHRANLPVAIAFNCNIGRYKTWQYGEKKDTEKEANFLDRLKETAENIHIFRNYRRVQLPLSEDMIPGLKAGDKVLLNGIVYTARDAAHRRLVMMLKEDKSLPFDLKGQVIYYVGPAPPKPGHVIGSAGPTTSYRMDPYTPQLLACGLKGMIGKGYRSPGVIDAVKRYHALYFITFAGAGALLSRHIARSETIAFADLGTEAIRRLELRDFPAIVACDAEGRDIYKTF